MRLRFVRSARRAQTIFALSLLAAALMPAAAQAWTYKVIYNFCSKPNCEDGLDPRARLLLDSSGNIYGTTTSGGKSYRGTVFELTPNGSHWRHRVLSRGMLGTADAPLIMDVDGNLYTTAFMGGRYLNGAVFKLVHEQTGDTWKTLTLYTFCRSDSYICPDGRWPEGGLTYAGAATGMLYDGVSPLYGSTDDGGSDFDTGAGAVFQLKPRATGHWNEKVIYTFCSQENCNDGIHPSVGGIIEDGSGNLFGTTKSGGANSQGTVFELSADAKKKQWTETTLYTFCSQAQCADGAYGRGALVLDYLGSLFGVTLEGGNSCPTDSTGCGVMFKVVPNGEQSAYTVLYAFCAQQDCHDGMYPAAGLSINLTGNLYGATSEGGGNDISNSAGAGALFSFNGSEQVLHAFCGKAQCIDGRNPYGGLTMDAAGNLFGTTEYGGKYDGGTVFELSP